MIIEVFAGSGFVAVQAAMIKPGGSLSSKLRGCSASRRPPFKIEGLEPFSCLSVLMLDLISPSFPLFQPTSCQRMLRWML
jgi:hypothetical protein